MQRLSKMLCLCVTLLLVPLALAGCQESTTAVSQPPPAVPSTESERLKLKVDEMKDMAFVAEVREDMMEGKYHRRWSQDGKGSWRWDRISSEPTSPEAGFVITEELMPEMMIFNADQSTAWLLIGEVAYRITDPEYLKLKDETGNPFSIQVIASETGGSFSVAGEGDVWEWHATLSDKPPKRNQGDRISHDPWQRLEFHGPEGFLSKEITGDLIGGIEPEILWEKNFEYLVVGSVDAELFELPESIKEVRFYEEYIQLLTQAAESRR